MLSEGRYIDLTQNGTILIYYCTIIGLNHMLQPSEHGQIMQIYADKQKKIKNRPMFLKRSVMLACQLFIQIYVISM